MLVKNNWKQIILKVKLFMYIMNKIAWNDIFYTHKQTLQKVVKEARNSGME